MDDAKENLKEREETKEKKEKKKTEKKQNNSFAKRINDLLNVNRRRLHRRPRRDSTRLPRYNGRQRIRPSGLPLQEPLSQYVARNGHRGRQGPREALEAVTTSLKSQGNTICER